MATATFRVTFAQERSHRFGKAAWTTKWEVHVEAKLPCGTARGRATRGGRQEAEKEARNAAARNAADIQRKCARAGKHTNHH